MTDNEFTNFKDHVKCKWLSCHAGGGLAGRGDCFAGGNFQDPECWAYKNEDEFERQAQAAEDEKILTETGI